MRFFRWVLVLVVVLSALPRDAICQDNNSTGPVWEACGDNPSAVLPTLCVSFSIPDSCRAVLSLSLNDAQNPPVFSQDIALAELEASDEVCVPVQLPAVVGLLVGDCSALCVALGANYSSWPTQACPRLSSDNCSALLGAPAELGCQPAPQLDEPCDDTDDTNSTCSDDDCSAPAGRCDQASGYCVCAENYGGDDCSSQCSVSGVLDDVSGRFTFVPLLDAESTHALHFADVQSPLRLAIEISAADGVEPVKQPNLYWWLPGFSVSAAYVHAVVRSPDSPTLAVQSSQGCPTTADTPVLHSANDTLVALFDPERAFPVPHGVQLWFLTVSPSTNHSQLTVDIVSPWLYAAPVEVYVLNGIAAWLSPGGEVFFRFNLSYASPIDFTVTSSNAPVAHLSYSSDDQRIPPLHLLDTPATTVQAHTNSPAQSSIWTVRVGVLSPSSSSSSSSLSEGSRVTLKINVQPSCRAHCQTEHGFCYYDGDCACNGGWGGADCSVPVCSPACGVHGTCVAPDVCQCEPDWSGPYCIDHGYNFSSSADDWADDDVATQIVDMLVAPVLLVSFLVIVPLAFWLYSKREECLARPAYDVIATF